MSPAAPQRCPFLREARVRQCRASAYRKMILRTPRPAGEERCSTGEYRACPGYRESGSGAALDTGSCPFLDESEMQYCAAAPVAKYVPCSEALLHRCGNAQYHYCDLYLALSEAGGDDDAPVEGIALPRRLRYARNHMWLEAGADETWHVGIDAFLARTMGAVERLALLSLPGWRRPAAVLTAAGVDLTLVFPHAMTITGTHAWLRARPSVLTEDPYGQGWLFEGTGPEMAGLLEGVAAEDWMRTEVDRMSRFAHDRLHPGQPADGGGFGPDLLEHLAREERLALFHEFFSLPAEEKGSR